MYAGHAERRTQHGHAAQQENGAGNREKSAQDHHSVLVEDDDGDADHAHHRCDYLGYDETAGNVGNVLQNQVCIEQYT